MRLILASCSPRRAEILHGAGYVFEVLPSEIDESQRSGESPRDLAERLAREKAAAAAQSVACEALVLGADTVVALDGQIFGKPADAAEARATLRSLSGRTHEVLTGLALLKLPGNEMRSAVERTRVTFAPLSDSEIEDYAVTEEPFGKAGGYAIQGGAGKFVARIEGDYWNVVGLPLARFRAIAREMGCED